MTYQEECLLRAKMLLDAAAGVEFEFKNSLGRWDKAGHTTFHLDLDRYRRKPVIKRYEAVVLWVEFNNGGLWHGTFSNDTDADTYVAGYLKSKNGKEIKRETVWVEINE